MKPHIIANKEIINFTALVSKIIDRWYFFITSILISLVVAYFYLKTITPEYEIITTLMIENESPSLSSERVLEDLELFSKNRNILNEKIILGSYYMVSETLKELNFLVSYYHDKGYSKTEQYKYNPFIVIFDSINPQPINLLYEIEFTSQNKFKIKFKGENIHLYSYTKQSEVGIIDKLEYSGNYSFGDEITTPWSSFRIVKNINNASITNVVGDKYIFEFNSFEELTMKYINSLEIDLYEKSVDVLSISLKENNITKATDFLNQLTKVYITKKLEKKNLNANNTIKFIDEQLTLITDSLNDAESRLQNFRSSSKMMDIGYQAQQLFKRISDLEKEKAILLAQQKYFDYANETINKEVNLIGLILPSSIGIHDEILNKLVKELVDLNTQKATLSSYTSNKPPALSNLENQINNIKKLIISNLNNLNTTTGISIKDINNQLLELENEARKLPITQQKLFGFERQFTLNNEIYTFLMKKRAEAQIAKASNTADSEIIDIARNNVYNTVSIEPKRIFIIAFLIGLFIPLSLIFLDIVSKKVILTPKEIENFTNIPVIGEIVHSKFINHSGLGELPKHIIIESFRALYNNLQYCNAGKQNQVISISSSMPKDGKTFTAANLAWFLSFLGQKTCLVSFDLRKPMIHKLFNISNGIGLSDYLNNNASIEDIIIKNTEEKTFDIITSGPLLSNPLELIASEQTEHLIKYLQSIYKYIIIDTPPIEVVADGLLIAKHSNINLIISKLNYTKKKAFINTLCKLIDNKIQNIAIICNGIKRRDMNNLNVEYFRDEKRNQWKVFTKMFHK